MSRAIRALILFAIGGFLGFFAPVLVRNHVSQFTRLCKTKRTIVFSGHNEKKANNHQLKRKKLLLIGVMTAEKFLETRAKAVYETWGKNVPGKLLFFASSSSKRDDLPIVSLEGVDDSYPPQRKSMMMLKYMHDNYIDDYEWFLRSDDDVYIRTEKLENFLRTLNSSEDLYIGQAGTGARNEKGLLGLGWGDNFCMGGPSAILTSSTLRKVTPYFEHCLNNLVTIHEDVEVGRCIKNYVGISCTWSFEMQSLFYHNRSREKAFTHNLNTKAVQNAITLHPLKRAEYMYRLHSHFMQSRITDLTYQSITIQRRLRLLYKLIKKGLVKFKISELVKLNDIKNFNERMSKSESPTWEMLTPRKVYSIDTNSPEIGMLSPTKDGMNIVLGQTMSIINQEARKVLHRTLEFKRLNHGYRRYHPLFGMQYMLDLLMKYHRHIGRNRRRMTVHVRHHAYLQQPFGNLIYTIETVKVKPVIDFILPVAGRLLQFERFMANFERIALRNQNDVVATLVVLYFTEVSPSHDHIKIFNMYRKRYPKAKLDWIDMEGAFSRSLALTMGASQFDKKSLLFFCDVDLEIREGFLSRCRQNAKRGSQVYYPIVFSQYNPEISFWNEAPSNTTFNYGKDIGFWRQYGFGITCQYKMDFDLIGGFDTTIQGWGLEDVELYDRYVLSEMHTVFRAPDPGLVHIYHDVTCDKGLAEKQLNMCYASKAQTYGSQRKLYEVLTDKDYIKQVL